MAIWGKPSQLGNHFTTVTLFSYPLLSLHCYLPLLPDPFATWRPSLSSSAAHTWPQACDSHPGFFPNSPKAHSGLKKEKKGTFLFILGAPQRRQEPHLFPPYFSASHSVWCKVSSVVFVEWIKDILSFSGGLFKHLQLQA